RQRSGERGRAVRGGDADLALQRSRRMALRIPSVDIRLPCSRGHLWSWSGFGDFTLIACEIPRIRPGTGTATVYSTGRRVRCVAMLRCIITLSAPNRGNPASMPQFGEIHRVNWNVRGPAVRRRLRVLIGNSKRRFLVFSRWVGVTE